jgi:thiol-disulfide isomerase/thioredoxin
VVSKHSEPRARCPRARERWAAGALLAVALAFGAAVEAGGARPAEPLEIALADGAVSVPLARYPARGESLILWLPHGIGGPEAEERLAARLAALGIEVWRPDLLAAHFLPALESSLEQIAPQEVAELIEHARRASGKRVYLLASARAGVLALRAAQAWQSRHPADRGLGGAILLHPNLYLGPPEPGKEAEYHPVVGQVRLPVFIVQPERSPWHFRLEALKAELERGGAVHTRLLSGVRDRYYFRPDATPAEDAEARRLPALLHEAIARLAQTQAATTATPAAASPEAKPASARVRELRPYAGDPAPPPLRLADLAGKTHDLADYQGQVVLVNFWATWCPPCVKEMPSMQRLQDNLAGKSFAVLAVNMGEDEKTVRAFLGKIPVDFTILLDRDGAALKRWKVFVFPTSFVLGPDGRIEYGLYGELEWDTENTIAIIEGLMPKE